MCTTNSSNDISDFRDKLGCVRMVAFGVLEFENGKMPPRTHEMQTLLKTVSEEFALLGWKFAVQARHRNSNDFILLGPVMSGNAFTTRERIAEGTLQEVCKAAIDYIEREAPCPDQTGVFWKEEL